MSVKSTIEGIFKNNFKGIQAWPKGKASAALLKLKAMVQQMEIYSRIYTGKVEKIGSNPRGAALRKIQQDTGSAELQEILTGNDLTKINTLAGKILSGEVNLGARIKTIELEASLQKTIDLFNQAAAALDRLIANPADADARQALIDADRQLQILLHPDQDPEIRYALSQEPPKPAQPGFLSRLSGTASSVVTNVTQRLKTLELRRIARDYGVPLALAAASHATEHPEMFATYAGLTLLTNLVGSCRRKPQRPLPGKQSPLPPATTTTVVTQPLAPALQQLQQSGQPSAAPSPAHSDQAGDEIAEEEQPADGTSLRAPALTQLPPTEQQLAPAPSQQLTPPPVSGKTEQPSDDQQSAQLQHVLKPKGPKKLHRPTNPTAFQFSAVPPQGLPKPQARKTPSPPGAPSVSPTLSPPVSFSGAFQPLASSQKPVPKMGAVGFGLPLAQEAARKAQLKAAASQTQSLALVQPKPLASAHATALLPAKKAAQPPYYVTAGGASQFHVGGKYACNFITGYLQIRMLEASKEKRHLTSEDLNMVMMQGASAYEGCLKHHNEATGQSGHHAFTWTECLERDKTLSSRLEPVRTYATIVTQPKATIFGTFPPIREKEFTDIFGELIAAAEQAQGALVSATVTFGSDAGVAESFPVGIRKIVGGYEYIFGNSHGTDKESDSIQVNRFNPVVQNYKLHFQRYLAERLSAVRASQEGTIGVEVSINRLKG